MAKFGGNYTYMQTAITPGTPQWLNESRILPTSQPFIQVSFYVGANAENDEEVNMFIGKDTINQRILILPRHYISSASFDGISIGSRKGSIDIIDPEGRWSTCMGYIGEFKNSAKGRGSANMIVTFGWVGLRPDADGSSALQHIPSFLEKTAMSMGEDGSLSIKLQFMETSERATANIKFNTLGDLVLLNSTVNPEIKTKKVYELLEYICSKDSQSASAIALQMETAGLFINFEETFETEMPIGDDSKNIIVRIGDTLESKITELTSMAMPENPDDPDYTWSYELIDKKILVANKDASGVKRFGTELTYGWKKAPTEAKLATMSEAEKAAATATGTDLTIKPEKGPDLLWKRQSTVMEEKGLMTFDIDLKMLDLATGMMQGPLEQRLSGFQEKNWENMANLVERMSTDKDKVDLLQLNPEQLSDLANAEEGGGDITDFKPQPFFNLQPGSHKDDLEMQKASVEFTKVLRDSRSNTRKQIQTVIQNNMFTAKAKIMGDPSFGTIYTMGKAYFQSDFTAVGQFASYFNRPWTLMKVSHKIEEGAFFTEIEMMSPPPPVAADLPPSKQGYSMGPPPATKTKSKWD